MKTILITVLSTLTFCATEIVCAEEATPPTHKVAKSVSATKGQVASSKAPVMVAKRSPGKGVLKEKVNADAVRFDETVTLTKIDWASIHTDP